MSDDVAADDIVENYRVLYSLYIKYMQAGMNGTDSLDLLALASLCPERNGGAVFQARALYSVVFDDINFFYDDSCLDADTTYVAAKHTRNTAGVNRPSEPSTQRYQLYPNPNNGTFVLQQYVADDKPVRVRIYDVTGRSVYSNDLAFAGNRSELNAGDIPPGVYLLEVKDSRNRVFRFKFVVTK